MARRRILQAYIHPMKTRTLLIPAVFGLLLLAVTWYYVFKGNNTAHNHVAPAELPAFSFTQFDGSDFTRDSLRPETPTVVMLFDPDCEHCQHELETIQKNIAAFQGVQLLLVSPADRTRLIPFASERGLKALPGVHVLGTDAPAFLETFGTTKMPSSFFYDAEGDLRQEMIGPPKEEQLLEALKQVKE